MSTAGTATVTAIVNSIASPTPSLEYSPPLANSAYSTLPVNETKQPDIKMQVNVQAPGSDLPFGSHIREALSVVKDWMHER